MYTDIMVTTATIHDKKIYHDFRKKFTGIAQMQCTEKSIENASIYLKILPHRGPKIGSKFC